MASVLAGGCGYTSQYAAPQDGRARAVWRDDNVVMEPSGATVSQECAQEIMQLTGSRRLRLPPEYVVNREEGGYWASSYYGPQIVVVRPGLAPLFPRPPLFMPPLWVGRGRPGSGPMGGLSGGGGGLHGGGGGSHGGGGGSHGGGGGGGSHGGGGGGGGGGNNGAGLVYVAVVALAVLPAVDLALALSRPESEKDSSHAIDQVNAYNDLARSIGSPCSYDVASAASAGDQP